MHNIFKILFPCFIIVLLSACASKKIKKVAYLQDSKALVTSYPKLNIFKTRKSKKNPVIIFIYGGSWQSGNKDLYSFLGRNLAKKDIVTVIPNYTLSPHGNYNTMAQEVAAAIDWTYNNISTYNCDPEQIFLMGHSAGGHLIALVGTNPKYLKNIEMVKGIILNDAAGLDMYSYLQKNPPTSAQHYDVTWTKNPDNWKDASPIYFLSEKTPPVLIYTGTKSYPSIISGSQDFVKKLNAFQPSVEIKYLNKKHVPMMFQFIKPWNKRYEEITDFIKIQKID